MKWLAFLKARLAERSTRLALVAAVSALTGAQIDPAYADVIYSVGLMAAAGIASLTKEKTSAHVDAAAVAPEVANAAVSAVNKAIPTGPAHDAIAVAAINAVNAAVLKSLTK